ncbi:tryptophan halogenase family protein [Hyphomonas sp.]|uniref:tryptophan halogenase family protein n=1 Tax=Hyphomonas sp. TaxID=87 RepID=UPI00391A59FF
MDEVNHVVIVGGGTAGWLTACILAADHRTASGGGLKVTLIESPGIPILGVGEGTWPSLRDTLRRIGLSESEFIRRCQASFKQGSRFDGWLDGRPGDTYYHPFDALPPADDVNALALWHSAPAGTPFAAAVSAQVHLCTAGRAPKQPQTPEYAAVANYAYHLDAPAFAALLCEHGTRHLGIRHIRDDVTGVRRAQGGSVEAVETSANGAIAADLFVDCSGARGLLIGDALGVPLKDVSACLFNDRALAIQVPYAAPDAPIASQTNAAAQPAGWIWDIGLQSRRGIGHVYASAFRSEEDARADLTAYLAGTAPGCGFTGADARLISFRSAYRDTPWTENVVAIGMSQGFVEPLEASAIVMIELAAAQLSDTLPPVKSLFASAARQFNARAAYRWERITEFLKLHYILSQRTEPYWQAHRDPGSWPARLIEGMARWQHMPPSREDFPQSQEIFPAASYAFILYGMGHRPQAGALRRRRDDPALAKRYLADIDARTRKFLAGLPAHRELIQHICERGLARA